MTFNGDDLQLTTLAGEAEEASHLYTHLRRKRVKDNSLLSLLYPLPSPLA